MKPDGTACCGAIMAKKMCISEKEEAVSLKNKTRER